MTLPADKVQRITEFLQSELDQDFIWVLLFEQDGGGVLAGNMKRDALVEVLTDHLNQLLGSGEEGILLIPMSGELR
jgi:hypothetical protein